MRYKYTFDLEFKIHKWMNSMLVPYDWDADQQFTENDLNDILYDNELEDLDDERDDMQATVYLEKDGLVWEMVEPEEDY